jgi:hypothetical protein
MFEFTISSLDAETKEKHEGNISQDTDNLPNTNRE